MAMGMKAPRTTKGGELKCKADVTLTAQLAACALASRATWNEKDRAYEPPVWARTRTSTLRGILAAITEEGTDHYRQRAGCESWRDDFSTQDEALAALRMGRQVVAKHFPELAEV